MKKLLILISLIFLVYLSFGQNNVTFRVDMNDYTGTFDSVYVNGTYNNWCGYCNPMSDLDLDGIWELTIPLTPNSIEFKFTLDGWTVEETLAPGSPCTMTTGSFTNRFLSTDKDTILPIYCWESCDSCTGSPVNSSITFRVDMNEYTGTYTDVHLNGTFNSWCGSCAPMDDTDGDGVYELEVVVPTDTLEYKFTLDGWTVEESFVGGEPCTMTTGTFTNRYLIPTGDTILPDVCWESCNPCSVGLNEISEIDKFEVYPNLSTGKFNYSIYLKSTQIVELTITNLIGESVYSESLNGDNLQGEIDLTDQSKGMYLVKIRTENDILTKKIVIQ